MSKEKTVINQELCDHIKALLGGGLTQKQAAKFARISAATVSRIQAAGFSVITYNHNTEVRRIEEKNRTADKMIEELELKDIKFPLTVEKVVEKDGGLEITTRQAEEQVTGQISMELPEKPTEEEKPEMSDQTKMMRFLAGKFNELEQNQQICIGELILQVGKIQDSMNQVRDYMAQIMRRMDK